MIKTITNVNLNEMTKNLFNTKKHEFYKENKNICDSININNSYFINNHVENSILNNSTNKILDSEHKLSVLQKSNNKTSKFKHSSTMKNNTKEFIEKFKIQNFFNPEEENIYNIKLREGEDNKKSRYNQMDKDNKNLGDNELLFDYEEIEDLLFYYINNLYESKTDDLSSNNIIPSLKEKIDEIISEKYFFPENFEQENKQTDILHELSDISDSRNKSTKFSLNKYKLLGQFYSKTENIKKYFIVH